MNNAASFFAALIASCGRDGTNAATNGRHVQAADLRAG